MKHQPPWAHYDHDTLVIKPKIGIVRLTFLVTVTICAIACTGLTTTLPVSLDLTGTIFHASFSGAIALFLWIYLFNTARKSTNRKSLKMSSTGIVVETKTFFKTSRTHYAFGQLKLKSGEDQAGDTIRTWITLTCTRTGRFDKMIFPNDFEGDARRYAYWVFQQLTKAQNTLGKDSNTSAEDEAKMLSNLSQVQRKSKNSHKKPIW